MAVTITEIGTYFVECPSFEDPNNFAATCWLKDATGNIIAFWRFYFDASKAAPNEFRDDLRSRNQDRDHAPAGGSL